MKFAIRIAGAVVVFGVVASLAWARPQLLSDAGCDFWNLPRWNAEVRRNEKSQEDIDIESAVVLQRLRAKNALVEALIAGEITTAQALARFRDLDPDLENRLRLGTLAGNAAGEQLVYENLVNFVRCQSWIRADGPQILARLARDWEAMQLQRPR